MGVRSGFNFNKFKAFETELTAEERRAARMICLSARARHGSILEAARAMGVGPTTLSNICGGTRDCGAKVYKQLKKYEASLDVER